MATSTAEIDALDAAIAAASKELEDLKIEQQRVDTLIEECEAQSDNINMMTRKIDTTLEDCIEESDELKTLINCDDAISMGAIQNCMDWANLKQIQVLLCVPLF